MKKKGISNTFKSLFYTTFSLLFSTLFSCNFSVYAAGQQLSSWNNSNRLSQSFWNMNPSDADIINALFGVGSIYTRQRDETCDTSNMQVVHITSYDTSIYGHYSLGAENTIYVIETGYVLFHGDYTNPSNFSLQNCSAVISKINGGSTILNNKNPSHQAINLGGDNIIIDNINIDGIYKSPTTKKTGNNPTYYGILIDGTIVKNITINNLLISNIILGGLYLKNNRSVSKINNMVMNNITSYNNNIGRNAESDGSVYTLYGTNIVLNNIKSFDQPENSNILIGIGSSGISINNSYFAPHNGNNINIDIQSQWNNTNNVIINNTIGNIKATDIGSCILHNVIGTLSGRNSACTLYGYQKYFNNTGSSISTDGSITISGNLNTTWPQGTRTNLGCLTWDYIINPTTGGYQNSRFSWTANNMTSSGCLTISNINTGVSYSNSNLKFSYGSGILNQDAPVYRNGNTLSKLNIPYNTSMPIGGNISLINGTISPNTIESNTSGGTIKIDASNSTITKVSAFSPYLTTQITNKSKGQIFNISFVGNYGTKPIIAQLSGNSYFATHFLKTVTFTGVATPPVTTGYCDFELNSTTKNECAAVMNWSPFKNYSASTQSDTPYKLIGFKNNAWFSREENTINFTAGSQIGTFTHTGYCSYKSGNSIVTGNSHTLTITVEDSLPTARNFTVTGVGGSSKTVSWKTLGNAQDGQCGNSTLTATTSSPRPTKGTCTVNGNNITFTPNCILQGDDTCGITITDDEGNDKQITVTRKDISCGGITGELIINTGAEFTNNPNLNLRIQHNQAYNMTRMKYSCNNSSWSDIINYQDNFNLDLRYNGPIGCTTTDGLKNVRVWISSTLALSGTINDSIIYDATRPIVQITLDSEGGNVTLSDTTSGLSGGNILYNWTTSSNCPTNSSSYTLSNYSNNINPGSTQFSFHVPAPTTLPAGRYSLCIYSGIYDRAGNSSLLTKSSITYNYTGNGGGGHTIPILLGTIIINNGAEFTNNSTLSLKLSATSNSGTIKKMKFSCNGTTRSSEENYSTNKTFALGSYSSAGCNTSDDLKTVYVQFKDSNGNRSPSANDTIIYDKTEPSISYTINSSSRKLTLTVQDQLSKLSGTNITVKYYLSTTTTCSTSLSNYNKSLNLNNINGGTIGSGNITYNSNTKRICIYSGIYDRAGNSTSRTTINISNTTSNCGNGSIENGETCDEGGLNGQSGHCNNNCNGFVPLCGNGTKEAGETCDDGINNGQYNHCNSSCNGSIYCGNGLIEFDEICDDGTQNGQANKCNTECNGFIDALDPEYTGSDGCRRSIQPTPSIIGQNNKRNLITAKFSCYATKSKIDKLSCDKEYLAQYDENIFRDKNCFEERLGNGIESIKYIFDLNDNDNTLKGIDYNDLSHYFTITTGNLSRYITTPINSDPVRFDFQGPKTEITTGYFEGGKLKVNITDKDNRDADGNISTCYYEGKNGYGSITNGIEIRECNSELIINTNITTTIVARAIDDLGNTGERNEFTIYSNGGVPQLGQTILYSGNHINTEGTEYFKGKIYAKASHDNNNIERCEYTIDGGSTRLLGKINSSECFINGITHNESININFRAISKNGQYATGIGLVAIYDGTAPYLDAKDEFICSEENVRCNTDQTEHFFFYDTGAGISGENILECTIQDEGENKTCTITGNVICDQLGNCYNDEIISYGINLDKTAPNAILSGANTSGCVDYYIETGTNIELVANDPLSGLPENYISRDGGPRTGINTIANRNGEIIVWIRDKAGNKTTIKEYLENGYDIDSPIVSTQNRIIGYECETLTGILDVTDEGCGKHNLQAIRNLGTVITGVEYDNHFFFTFETGSNEVSSGIVGYNVIDGVGHETTGEIYFDWQDVPVTAHGIKMYLDQNQELYENWIEITEAKAGTCENLSAEVINHEIIGSIFGRSGSFCEISGDFIKIIGTTSAGISTQGVKCKIRITDGDSNIEVTITGEINRNAPTFSKDIEFIGGSGYINRGPNKYGLKKLTNDKKVLVHFEGDSPTPINSFKMSCISGDNICTEIETNSGESFSSFICNSLYPIGHIRGNWDENSDMNNLINTRISQDAIDRCKFRLDGGWIGNLYTFFSRDDKYTTDLVKCNKIDEARSNRYQVDGDYTSTDNYSFENKKIFENNTIKYHFSGTILRDLEDGSGCQPTVFGSPELGYRNVYVQVKNTKSKESEKKGSEEIFYDNVNPVINLREYERIITMQGYTTNVGNISIYDPKINYKKKGIVSNELGNLYQSASKIRIATEGRKDGIETFWAVIGTIFGDLNSQVELFVKNHKELTANTPYSLINMNIGTDYWHTIGSCVKTGKESKFISYLTGENKLDEDDFQCDCSKCNASEIITTGTKINDGCECTNGNRNTYNTKINDTCVGLTSTETEISSTTYINDTCYCNDENGGYIYTGEKIDDSCKTYYEMDVLTGNELNTVQNIYSGYDCELANTTTKKDIPEGLLSNYTDLGYSCSYSNIQNGECTKREKQCTNRFIVCLASENVCVEHEQIKLYNCNRNEIKCKKYECMSCPSNNYTCSTYSKYDCYDCNEYNCCSNNGDTCSEYLCNYTPCTTIDQNMNPEYFVFGIQQSSIYPPLFEPSGINTSTTRGTTTNTNNDLIELYLSGGNNKLILISGNISFNWDITKAERGVGDDGELDSKFAYTMNIKNIVIDNLSVEGKGEVWLHLKTGFATDFAGNPTNEHREKTNIEIVSKDILGANSPYTLGTQDNEQKIRVYTMTEDLELGTGSIICKSSSLCQGFSCNEKGVTKVRNIQKTIDGAIYHKEREITLDKMTLDTGVDEKNFTGCIIELTDNNKSKFQNTGVNIDIKLYANLGVFMAGDAGDETRRPISEVLNNANRDGLQDKGFLFYISQPHITKFGNTTGVLGNLDYEMEFSGGEVVDEYYYITGTAIVNGFFNEIGIKKPTYNYKNPNAWQSTFPVY